MTRVRVGHIRDNIAVSTDDGQTPNTCWCSATHALETYLDLKARLESAPAMDFTDVVLIETSPSPDNPGDDRLDTLVFLDRCLSETRGRTSLFRWRVWEAVRFHHKSLRQAASLEANARRLEADSCWEYAEIREWADRYSYQIPHDVEDVFEWAMNRAACSRTTARKYVHQVDSILENILDERGVLVFGRRFPEDDEGANQV